MKRKGLIILYTGNGKGKTTAAFGLALRALGHGQKVLIIQFIKSKTDSGELAIRDKWQGSVDIRVAGSGFIRTKEDAEKRRKESAVAWKSARESIVSGAYRLVILDELTHLVSLGLVREDEVLDCLSRKPQSVHVVITGRDASASLVDAADIVTEMKEVKHSFTAGVKAQQGIEW